MSITNGYQKQRGRNHFLSYMGNYRTKQKIFSNQLILYIIKFLVLLGNTWEDAAKKIETKNLHKKRPPENGVF